MKLVAQQGDRRFWFLRLEQPYETVVPSFGAPFVAIVVACDPQITSNQQATISAQLVAQDCRYMLAWGINATSWDSSVDIAFINTDPDFNPPDDRHVMTTLHDNETIDDVVWFALTNTNFDFHEFHDYLALMIGDNPKIESEVLAAIRSKLVTPEGCEPSHAREWRWPADFRNPCPLPPPRDAGRYRTDQRPLTHANPYEACQLENPPGATSPGLLSLILAVPQCICVLAVLSIDGLAYLQVGFPWTSGTEYGLVCARLVTLLLSSFCLWSEITTGDKVHVMKNLSISLLLPAYLYVLYSTCFNGVIGLEELLAMWSEPNGMVSAIYTWSHLAFGITGIIYACTILVTARFLTPEIKLSDNQAVNPSRR